MSLILKSAFLLLALYALVLGLLWFGQEKLLFQPQKLPQDHRFNQGPDVHEIWVDVPGARLNALHLRRPQPQGVVFFVHGNAGSLENWFVNVDFYRQANFDLFMFDYRGFGKSNGRIESQAHLEADVRAAWESIAPRYAGLRKVFYGRSLGTGLATNLAVQTPPDLLVLVSAYSSMVAVAAQHYGWVPSALLRYPLRTDLMLPQVKNPVLLVHGGLDTLIPPSHSEVLHALVPQSEFLLVPEAGHNDIQEFTVYLNTLAAAMRGQPLAQTSEPLR
jgi:hypothetical protein